ncbi:MAG: SAVED domain-containing protein [Thermomicrobia bacterium]|nr:SAVED domain-containing protein [Thermomicrobia bacterium]MCA1724451.1 SAVED domain-containing protein [Thermomicrobia bacterium]
MTLKKLFLSHQHGDAPAVRELATDLRLRGIAPWVDKDGGFSVGDESVAEARRVIREDCFGLLLYATEAAFTSRFIRDTELDEAAAVKRGDPAYILFAVPCDMAFRALQERCVTEFGVDLAAFHGVPIHAATAPADRAAVASDVVAKVLRRGQSVTPDTGTLSLQFSTREMLPDMPGDVLRIDAVPLLAATPGDAGAWNRLLDALRDVKARIAAIDGRPRLSVHGSKHLTAAFLFGRVFAPFELEIRQTPTAVWHTDTPVTATAPLAACCVPGAADTGTLFVEIASRDKDVAMGVNALIAGGLPPPSVRLQLRPPSAPLVVDNELCRAMVAQVYAEIGRAMQRRRISAILLFAAAPQALMMMLGREFRGMPPVQLYEWDGGQYLPSCRIPAGVL